MAAGARAGAVRASVLRIDRKPVAQLFSIRHGALLAAFKITYDEAFAAYSPGVHVLVEAMRDMLEDPSIEMFDSCARPGHPVAESLWRERMTMSDINIACRGADAAILKFCAGLENFKRSAARLARRSETEANDA